MDRGAKKKFFSGNLGKMRIYIKKETQIEIDATFQVIDTIDKSKLFTDCQFFLASSKKSFCQHKNKKEKKNNNNLKKMIKINKKALKKYQNFLDPSITAHF